MSNIKHSKLQIVDPKYWGSFTREEHLAWLGKKSYQYIDEKIEKVYELNYGDDNIVSFINKIPVVEVDEDVPYRWKLMGADERNIPLVKASLTSNGSQVTEADLTGDQGQPFYLWFPERYFEVTTHMVGNNPESYQLRVLEEPVQDGTNWRYKVKLFGDDLDLFMPASELEAETRFKELYGQTEQTLSQRGNSIHHASNFEMENTLSMIRKNYEVPGNLINAKSNGVLAMQSSDGKDVQTKWINKQEWDFFTQFRRDKARLFMYGKSNKLADGSYADKGESGNTMRSGFGLYEQMEAGNIMYYNTFNLDSLSSFAMQLSVGRVAEDKREFMLSTGEWGALEFHKAAQEKAGAYTGWSRSDHNWKQGGAELDEVQIKTYTFVNGIKFHVMIDPMKDNPIINTIPFKEGLASSYTYDIWDFGTTNGEANIQRVSLKGSPEVYKVVPGLRDPYSPAGLGDTPGITSSMVDGYTLGKAFWGGIRVGNVKKTGRLIPNVLRK